MKLSIPLSGLLLSCKNTTKLENINKMYDNKGNSVLQNELLLKYNI